MRSLPARTWLPSPRPINPAFSTWLDCFRWLAAFAVCLAHVRAGVMMDYSATMSPGWLAKAVYWLPGFAHSAVMVFFVLSGYLVGGEIRRGLQRGDFSWRVYASRRLARLYAGYLAALLLGALWDRIGLNFFNAQHLYSLTENFITVITYPISGRIDAATLAGNLVFCQDILVPPFGSNGPLWSLANEAWYYALVPLALWPCFGSGATRGRILSLGLLVAGAWFVRGNILLYLGIWLLGLAPHLLRRPLFRRPWLPAAAFVLVLTMARLHLLPQLTQWGHDLLVAGTFVLLLNSLEFHSRPAPGPAALHREMAAFSYTIYLGHWPLALLVIAVLQQEFGVGYRMPFSATAAGLLVLLLAFVYAYCWAVSLITERQTSRIRGWLLGSTCPAAPGKGTSI
jgi:peptidoglycan/LPS O-acetylase OafA/YrhL